MLYQLFEFILNNISYEKEVYFDGFVYNRRTPRVSVDGRRRGAGGAGAAADTRARRLPRAAPQAARATHAAHVRAAAAQAGRARAHQAL